LYASRTNIANSVPACPSIFVDHAPGLLMGQGAIFAIEYPLSRKVIVHQLNDNMKP
jgi:hypothetical protein